MATLAPSNTLAKLAGLEEAKARTVVESTFRAILDPNVEQTVTGADADAQIGLATLIALCVRQGSSSETLQSTLKDAGVPAAIQSQVADLYTQNVDVMRTKTANIAVNYNRITGCEWRLDYTVSNSESGPVLLPLFFVKLKLEGDRSIDFSCTEEELTTLVATLKDALNEAARTSQ